MLYKLRIRVVMQNRYLVIVLGLRLLITLHWDWVQCGVLALDSLTV